MYNKDLDKEILKDFLSISQNYIYSTNHFITSDDLETFKNIQNEFINKLGAKTPAPYDNIEIVSNNGHTFHAHAQLEKCSYNSTGWQYCENASSHYIDIECMSTSGGSFGQIDIKDLEYIGETTRTIWTWGSSGACANGGIYINVKVNNWRYKIDKKFIPLVCGTYKDSDYGYKYYIDVFHKKGAAFHSHKACFKTLKGFKNYLKNTGLRIGKKLCYGYGTSHEILGDFDFKQYFSAKEYAQEKGNLKEFPLLSNGSYTGAFFKDGFIHFCNCNVKDRPQYPYIQE